GEDPQARAIKEIEEELGLTKDRINLIKQGDPLIVVDKDHGVVWVVYPFLFDTNSDTIRLNWEHVESRWIEPHEILEYSTVPMLKEALERVAPTSLHPQTITIDAIIKDEIDKVRKDREHGSVWLAIEALKILKLASERIETSSLNEFIRYLMTLGRELILSRPSMAPLTNLIGSVLYRLLSYSKSKGFEHSISNMKAFISSEIDKVIDETRSAVLKVAKYASDLIPDDATIITHSFSSTVLQTLKYALQEGKRMSVYITESRPLFEGRKLAEGLLLEGKGENVVVTLITDSAAGYFVGDSDLVLVGADSILTDGSLVNKVGTYSLALAAKDKGVPFYTVCEKCKFDVRSYLGLRFTLEEKDPSEILYPNAPPSIKARNIYFDITPSRYITEIIMEEGRIKPGEVIQHMERIVENIYLP
ncbi:MAG: NUDIX domain-containing protein, partial [Nitrososphaerales archaeon]|nr:NUDIX domain-containing protein [Nitrososphaerales archaeon]